MNKEIEKLLFNPIRLKIVSFLISVESSSFKKLIEASAAPRNTTQQNQNTIKKWL